MQLVSSQEQWQARAGAVFPASGFGNFDPKLFIRNGKGSRVWDENSTEYLDLLIGSGPMLLGHGHPEVQEVVMEQLGKGMTFFTNNTVGVELAEKIREIVPCAEQLRYVTSGSEANMYAMRLARAFTGRSKILKFEGGYHGMSAEAQMSLAPSQGADFPTPVPDSAGIPRAVESDVLISPFNDIDFLKKLVAKCPGEIAGLIVEPIQRLIPAESGYLAALRELCSQAGIVLIFDEIVTGFRLAYGGAQEAYGVTPDICTLGKVIGGGFALAALAGSADIMAHFDKNSVGAERWLMQLGTLSGNPVAAVAGLKTLEILGRNGAYQQLQANGKRMMEIQSTALSQKGIPHQIVGVPSLFDVVFSETEVSNYRNHQVEDHELNNKYNNALRKKGILKAPNKIYTSLALEESDFALFENAVENAVNF